MSLSPSILRSMFPSAGVRLNDHLPYIEPAMSMGSIVTPKRVSSFCAQVGHESNDFLWMEEIASGDEYDTRTDLGNTPEIDGDGAWFKGHGPIQITGKANHAAVGRYLGINTIENPKLLTLPQYGTASAVWFWTIGNKKCNLNALADLDWFLTMTRVINGGLNGLRDRLDRWERNRRLFELEIYDRNKLTLIEDEKIRIFQRANGLNDDGAVGNITLAKIREVYARDNGMCNGDR